MNIPDEAIEAAATEYEATVFHQIEPISEMTHLTIKADLKQALTTAAPIIAAQTLRDEADRLAELANIHAATNLWFVVDAIRARADNLEARK